MSKDPAGITGIAGSGIHGEGEFGISNDKGKINVSRLGKPDAGALAAFDGLAGGSKKNSSCGDYSELNINIPGYPMKGTGTSVDSPDDNGVRGSMGGDDKPERSGNSRHMSS